MAVVSSGADQSRGIMSPVRGQAEPVLPTEISLIHMSKAQRLVVLRCFRRGQDEAPGPGKFSSLAKDDTEDKPYFISDTLQDRLEHGPRFGHFLPFMFASPTDRDQYGQHLHPIRSTPWSRSLSDARTHDRMSRDGTCWCIVHC